MVSTGWRTACVVIVMLIGAALLTFAAFVYRRQKLLRKNHTSNASQVKQRFMNSYSGDPEAHIPLLNTTDTNNISVPPKLHERNVSGGNVDGWNDSGPGRMVRHAPSRVPVPPIFPEPEPHANDKGESHSLYDKDIQEPPVSMAMPEPSVPNKPSLFPMPQPFRLPFPRIQLGGRKGRLPSLNIHFVRESNQVVSSPGDAFRPIIIPGLTPPPSTSSALSSLSRPFATMSNSPLPNIRTISPITLSSTAAAPPTTDRSLSPSPIESDLGSNPASPSVGHNLFSRKLSTEGASFQTLSRDSSYQNGRLSASDVPTWPRTSRRSSTSGLGASASAGAGEGDLRRAYTWVPNVMASYSPWHRVIPRLDTATDAAGSALGSGLTQGSEVGSAGRELDSQVEAESPLGEVRVADAYRPMPTLEETSEMEYPSLPRGLIPGPSECATVIGTVLSQPSAALQGSSRRKPVPSS